MTDLATLLQQHAEAKAAYHQRMMGKAAQKVADGGGSVEYNPVSMTDLSSYIAGLERRIIAAGGTVPGRTACSPIPVVMDR
mgnify:CR=1 FL=1